MPVSPLYFYPQKTIQTEMEIKHSRFIAFIGRAPGRNAATGFIDSIRKSHQDATHNCWAYIVGNPYNTSQMGSSDDGEPAGTAGKPMLNVLKHNQIGDVAVVVTRYFGGIKLGTGGLVRAYSGCVLQAIEELPLIGYVETITAEIIISYADEPGIRKFIETENVTIKDVRYGEYIQLILDVPIDLSESITQKIADLTRGRSKIKWETS